MKSSWPIVLGAVAVAIAAFWYDARNESVAAGRVIRPVSVVTPIAR